MSFAGPGELCRLIRETLCRMLGNQPLDEVLLAGNTAMHHLFCGLDVEPLTRAPFASPTLGSYRFTASDLGWPGPAEFLPCLGGFVGSDLLCGIVATRLDEQAQPHALVDIGTNGEVVVGSANGIVCASTAAGPAFEGGRIGIGMRAGVGAIDTVHVRNGELDCHVIGGGAARGICGSGLVDAAACGLELGLDWFQRPPAHRGQAPAADRGTLTDPEPTFASCNSPKAPWPRACAS